MNPQTQINDKTLKSHRIPVVHPAIRASAHTHGRKRGSWQAQPSGLSREEMRLIVLEMIG